MSDVDSLPVNKLQTKPLLWSFLPLQGTHQLLLELWQVLLIHLQTETGESDKRLFDCRWERLFPSHLTFIAGLSFLFDV